MVWLILLYREERFHFAGDRTLYYLGGEYMVLGLLEPAFVLLPINPRRQSAALLQELKCDTLAVDSRHLISLPTASARPLFVEDAPLAIRRGQQHEGTSEMASIGLTAK
jgi:hypothetical protein